MSQLEDYAIPKGSTVLVTAATGYINYPYSRPLPGYRVRGTTRSEKPWLNVFFEQKHGKDKFEINLS
jgi:hypothetical protein